MSENDINPGRVALVTGANKGIGRAIAEFLRDAGFRVAGTYRTGGVPEGVFGVQCDVTDQEQVDEAFAAVEARLGVVEVLVANAGMNRDRLLIRMSDEEWDQVIATNLTGAFRVVRRAVRPMIKARFGRIILISSVSGMVGTAGQVNYAASKSGLIGLARSVAREYGPRGVTANVITPGFIETDMTAALDADMQAGYLSRIPTGRFGTPGEIASAVGYLASDQAGYINGVVLPIDGGLSMGI